MTSQWYRGSHAQNGIIIIHTYVISGDMGKHSKNSAGLNDALTYHERKALGHGTAQERLGKVRPMEYNVCMFLMI